MQDEQQQHMQRERGTYSGSLHRPTVHIGDSRTGLDWALPVAKESEEQLGDGATVVVRLQEENEGRGEEWQAAMKTGDYAEIRKREITQRWMECYKKNTSLLGLMGYVPSWCCPPDLLQRAGRSPAALSTRRSSSSCCHNKTKTLSVWRQTTPSKARQGLSHTC